MAFALAAIYAGVTVQLNDGNPFRLLRASGLGGAAVRRVTVQGPTQDGDTDLGYRLQPRNISLVIGFSASTDAILDGYRDTLTNIFRPSTTKRLVLKVTRDDGGIRYLECLTRGNIDIALLPEHRAAHWHEATVNLYAPDPSYYNPTYGSVAVTGTVNLATNWYLAGGAIGSAQVLMNGLDPSFGNQWSYTGTIAETGSWTLALRLTETTLASSGSPNVYAYYVEGGYLQDVSFGATDTVYIHNGENVGPSVMPAIGTNNYFMRYDYNGFESTSVRFGIDRDIAFHGALPAYRTAFSSGTLAIGGTARRWRSNANFDLDSRWMGAIQRYALYSPGLSVSQINALTPFMSGTVGGSIAQSIAIAYNGDLPEYPVISITGPITSPRLTNSTTGDILDFGTITIGAGTTYVIDTRYGYKNVTVGTVSKRYELTDGSDLATWSLAPAPVATGGTNILIVGGSAIGTATRFSVVYYDRYASF